MADNREFNWLIRTFQKEDHVDLYDPPKDVKFSKDTISLEEWYMLHRLLNKCKPNRILELGCGPSSILFQHWTNHKIEAAHGVEMSIKNPQGQYDFAFVDDVDDQKIKIAKAHTDAIIVHDIEKEDIEKIIWSNLPTWKSTGFEGCPRLALFERPSPLEIDKQFRKPPFITIITRTSRRPKNLAEATETIKSQTDDDYQHLIIVDVIGKGLFSAGKSLWENKERIKGKWTYILDDDVRLVNNEFIARVKETAEKNLDAEIIMVRNYVGGRKCPSDDVWGGDKVFFGTVDSASFVVCKDLFNKYIHHHARHKGSDYAFINALFHLDPQPKIYWVDELMARAGSTHQGQRESDSTF